MNTAGFLKTQATTVVPKSRTLSTIQVPRRAFIFFVLGQQEHPQHFRSLSPGRLNFKIVSDYSMPIKSTTLNQICRN